MQSIEILDAAWRDNPQVIRTFVERRSKYEELAQEIDYILRRLLDKAGIEYANISHRAKELASFCEKIRRKEYKQPLDDITDLAGVRIAFLYVSDLPKIEAIVEQHFHVVEKSNKVSEKEADAFGYGAVHCVVKLGKQFLGARYDELKDLVCEIQIRSILQDAWAIVAHHLNYKQEADVPKILRRKLNRLSAMFEEADEAFDRLRVERAEYAKFLKRQALGESPAYLQDPINVETLTAYLQWRLPDRPRTPNDTSFALKSLREKNVMRLLDIDSYVIAADQMLETFKDEHGNPNVYGAGVVMVIALGAFERLGRNLNLDRSEVSKAFRKIFNFDEIRQ